MATSWSCCPQDQQSSVHVHRQRRYVNADDIVSADGAAATAQLLQLHRDRGNGMHALAAMLQQQAGVLLLHLGPLMPCMQALALLY
jgi:hypothetical protein